MQSMKIRSFKVIIAIAGVSLLAIILLGWIVVERLSEPNLTIEQQSALKDNVNDHASQKKVLNNFTSEDAYNQIAQVTPSLASRANDSLDGFEIIDIKVPIDSWAVVLIKPYENPDRVVIVTVLRDNGDALITKLKPIPVRKVENYINNEELPKEVISTLIEYSKRSL